VSKLSIKINIRGGGCFYQNLSKPDRPWRRQNVDFFGAVEMLTTVFNNVENRPPNLKASAKKTEPARHKY
jgi:hypothetical protein